MAAVAAAISSNTAFKQDPLSVSSTTHQFLGGFSKRFNFDQKFGGRKRDLIGLVVASATESSIRSGGGRFYFNFTGFPFPLGPFLNRRTIRTELVKELNAPVEYIVLPTYAYEHKIFVGPFSRKFPQAQIWVAPRQWSWPINLPLEFFGIFRSKPLIEQGGREWPSKSCSGVLQIFCSSLPVFDQMSRKLIFHPLPRHWVFSKVPEKVRDWVDRIAKDWPVQENHSCPFRSAHKCRQVRFLGSLCLPRRAPG